MSDYASDNRVAGSNRKIDPTRWTHLRSDCTPDDNEHVKIGPTQLAFDESQVAAVVPPDLPALRACRLQWL